MKPSERDELLIRLDQTVQDSLPRILTHLDKLNGVIVEHSRDITIIKTLQKERNKPSKKTIGSYIGGVVAISIALWKAFTTG